jgi:hypothetical protein
MEPVDRVGAKDAPASCSAVENEIALNIDDKNTGFSPVL